LGHPAVYLLFHWAISVACYYAIGQSIASCMLVIVVNSQPICPLSVKSHLVAC